MTLQYQDCSIHGTGRPFPEQQLLLVLQMHLYLPSSSSSSPLHLQVGQDFTP